MKRKKEGIRRLMDIPEGYRLATQAETIDFLYGYVDSNLFIYNDNTYLYIKEDKDA